eukprot:snap_masked-scaffold_12-processed-gene-5.40-mRNA-1 protein AED:0.19 eAED:1.00 QI:0/-1/0/1/-1/1/1/0/140
MHGTVPNQPVFVVRSDEINKANVPRAKVKPAALDPSAPEEENEDSITEQPGVKYYFPILFVIILLGLSTITYFASKVFIQRAFAAQEDSSISSSQIDPTPYPTNFPSNFPTKYPTEKPTDFPTEYPTNYPTPGPCIRWWC